MLSAFFWLHLHEESVKRAPPILEILLKMYDESVQAHGTRLPYSDYHVMESDERELDPFTSPGLIVVPRGAFDGEDPTQAYGLLAQQFAKEWGREAIRLHPMRRRA